MSNVANYMEQGGDTLVIGGDLRVISGGELRLDSGATLTAAGTQASAIANMTVVFTTGDPSITPNGAITIADGASPTVAELQEFCVELNAKLQAVLVALRNVGIVASA